ncbi:YqhG family protein [Gracilibacillus salinarum]|uniref:YqhG family protein n=1 Tax=Gracilibacillus salinarum TaxID=2932255 RepID=A0ABY4GNW3_9BACI|nr:YqhG family protein [Gracilibacillus salinarum]UOQ85992.1 YqhG family protein [Gracilibacillus salinarum]
MISNLHSFLTEYFVLHDCEIIQENQTELEVKLTRELDQVLMNRPFYWHYMDKLGRDGDPMSIQLDTSLEKKENQKEWIHYGSPRLHQIFQHIQQNARFTILYEETNGQSKTSLMPWLIVNVMIHYCGKQKREAIYSIGVHLINGAIQTNMMERVDHLSFSRQMTDYSYTISPIIKPVSGFRRAYQYVENHLFIEDFHWVEEAKKTLQEELELLEYFYQQKDNVELLTKERERLSERLEPKINLEVINAGLFYLTEQTSNQVIND